MVQYIGSTKYGMHVVTSSLDCSSKVWEKKEEGRRGEERTGEDRRGVQYMETQ